ncbi:hypothetical protein AA0522_0237 [Gluconacetobacter liquefaciens NRIC 0522]|nr:hypothetical protein AA0522_0237 [Gluconacetobacter liquefaciens NRIC 0522]
MISDMYLPEKYIHSLLSRAGLKKEVGLIVTNYGKHHGYIWKDILSNFSVKKHIGDNAHADVFRAAEAGIPSEITNSHQISPPEKIFFDIAFTAFGELCRETRLATWSTDANERKAQINQISFNFPILFFSSISLYRLAKKLNKKRIVFSSRDCHLWIGLFEAMYPGEFTCSYYYTSRYAKVFCADDYIAYTKEFLTDDAILVDICGSGWSLEKLCDNIDVARIDAFFIHKLPKDRGHMGIKTHGKCTFHAILDEGIEVYKSYFLEMVNFTDHGMVKDIRIVNGTPCPIFFDETRSEDEMRYVTTQKQAFDACVSRMKHYDLQPILEADMTICEKLVSIFYALLSKNTFMLDLYGQNFFRETEEVEKIIADSAISRYLNYKPDVIGKVDAQIEQGLYSIRTTSAGYVYVPKAPPRESAEVIARLAGIRFSVIVPIYNTPPHLVGRMLASVQRQWFPHWQVILVDNGSTSEETRRFLNEIEDQRVTIVRTSGIGISEATNTGLTQATGEYVLFLGHGDELADNCLYALAQAIASTNADYLYSDEDRVDAAGNHLHPSFKPDWSPDTCMSLMYTGNTCCVNRQLLDSIGNLRTEYDGSHIWDLVLRITEHTSRITHVPDVLYHSRQDMPVASTQSPHASEIIACGINVRTAALRRRGQIGTLEPVEHAPGFHRVSYAVQGDPLVSIIIPSRNNGQILLRCVDSFYLRSQWKQVEFIILDNGSDQPDTLSILNELNNRDAVQVIRHDAPFNYSELNNIGVRSSRGDILLHLNDDTELLTPDALTRMIGYAQLPHVGAVGAKLLYPGEQFIQHTGVVNLSQAPEHAFIRQPKYVPGYGMRGLLEYDWSAVTGACLMMERRKFDLVGGFDETFPVAYNDIELCFRALSRQFYNVMCPSALFLHYESMSRGSDFVTAERRARVTQDWQRLYTRHPSLLMHDAFHNPNLNPHNANFTLAL